MAVRVTSSAVLVAVARGSHSTGRIWPEGTDVICSLGTICGLQLL